MVQCIMCTVKIDDGNGWEHPDQECQDCFIDTGREVLAEAEVENLDEAEVAACSESCWREFMMLSWEQ